MVDLPTVPRQLVTTEAPNPGISAGDVIAPFAHQAAAMDKLGGALEDVGVDIAKEAGKHAVTTDDQGNLQVSTLPPIGKAAEAFNRSAQMTYLTQLEPNIKEKVLAKRLELDGNPGAFHDWAAQYTGELADGQPSDELRNSVKQLAERHTSSAYQGMAIARHSQDVTNNRVALKDGRDALDNDLAMLSRDGGTDSPAYQGRLADYLARQKQAQADPSLNYPESKAKADLDDMTMRHAVWGIIGAVRKTAEDKSADATGAPNGGVAKARDIADSILTDGSLNLSQEKRQQFYKVAVSEIKQLSAENRVLQSQLNVEAQSWTKSLKEGNTDAAGVRDFLTRAADAGATKAFAAVARESASQTWYRDWFSKLPAEDRANVVADMSGNADTRTYLDKVASVESGNNPNAQSSTSSAAGLFQYTRGTWLPLIKQVRPELAGKSDDELLALRKDPATARQVATVDADRNAGILAGQGIAPTDANKYVLHVLGQTDGIATLSAAPGTPLKGLISDAAIAANSDLFSRAPTSGAFVQWAQRKMGQAPTLPQAIAAADNPTRLSFLSTASRELKSTLKDNLGTIEKTITSGVQPSNSDMDALGALVHAVGDDDQKTRIVELAAKSQFGAAYINGSPTEREAMASQLKAKYATGGQAIVGELSDYAGTLNQRVSQAYKEDPYGASSQYGARPVLPGVTPQDPNGVAPGLQARVPEQTLIRNQQGLPAFTALRPAEADAWKTVLTQGDVQQAAGFLNSVAALPQDVAQATIASKPIADGIKGMVFSRDPARMEVGLTTLDRAWRTDPNATEKAVGKEAVDRMQVWQGLRDSFSSAEIAERLNPIDDPSKATARDALKATAEKETDKLAPADVANKFATGIYGTRWLAGGAANTPSNDLTAQELTAEYKTIRTALRTYGVDGDKADELAMKRLQQSWGPSAVNGNQVMKYPPEKYYPNIGGSHAWLNDEVTAAVTSAIGPRYGNLSPAPAGTPAGLVEPGNIDLSKRPQVRTPEGIATVRSLGVNIDGKETVIPTVSDDGRIMSNDEAVATYRKTGKHLGKFENVDQASAYGQALHEAQAAYYGGSQKTFVGDSEIDTSGGSQNWKVVGLVPAPNTGARIQRNEVPAYSIVIQKRNGELETVIDKAGRSAVTFDPKSYVDRYEGDMRARETQTKFRIGNLGIGAGYLVGSEL